MTLKETLDLITEDTYVCSDHHFGHANIVKFEPMRQERAKELGYAHWEDMVVQEHNKIVKEDDIVLILGDYAWKAWDQYMPLLNGRKIFIQGNHDKKQHTCFAENNVEVIRGLLIDYNDYVLELHQDELFSGVIKNMIINGMDYEVMLCHYALFNDDEYDHQNTKIRPRMEILEDMYESFGCEINIHGHLHSKKSSFIDAYSACLERIDFKPIKIKDLLTK